MRRGRPTRPVICVETGQVFNSVTEAAASIGMGPNNLTPALCDNDHTAGGYHWEYALPEDITELDKVEASKPKSAPSMTIEEVQAEAERRTRETGRYTRYAHIQIEETLRLMKNQTTVHKPKRRAKG